MKKKLTWKVRLALLGWGFWTRAESRTDDKQQKTSTPESRALKGLSSRHPPDILFLKTPTSLAEFR